MKHGGAWRLRNGFDVGGRVDPDPPRNVPVSPIRLAVEPYFRPYQTLIIWTVGIGLICIVAYLIYDFSRGRPDRPN